MKKPGYASTVSTLAVSAFVLAGALWQSSAQAATELRMANWLPPVHHLYKSLEAWNEEVSKASGGSLIVKLDKAPLAKPPGQYDLAKKGIADLSYPVLAYTPGRFEVARGSELPFLSPNATAGSKAMWDWYSRNVGNKEFNDVKLVTMWVHGPGLVHTKKQVKTLEDLVGVKLRVGGGGVAMSKALGAVPVAMSATKAHESLQRGTTDGALFPWEAIHGFRLTKLVKYHLQIPGGLYATPFALVMNKAKWNSLSAEHKAVLDKVGGLWGAGYIGERWDHADNVGRGDAKANGNIIQTIAPAELGRWRQKISFMDQDWIKKVNAKGWNGEALLKDLKATMKKYGQ
ncbi:MAG: ABC transporter substrate-binding protein [Rhodospirillaceae bacterium]|jgi:TRAP-type C4-dicarboxylate transport system substrate-binding protein|nr:ABC transporter substrate-binding protein [Rhodospirillaceae bacterium]|tara:strand:- start:595 stop:1626 length:1032 start_codon:yes stop_codon:yes gene_type:complete